MSGEISDDAMSRRNIYAVLASLLGQVPSVSVLQQAEKARRARHMHKGLRKVRGKQEGPNPAGSKLQREVLRHRLGVTCRGY